MTVSKDESNDWTERLADALTVLNVAQVPFLEWYFSASGYTRVLRNGIDETPFPTDAIYKLYNHALLERRLNNTNKFKNLKAALDPVRGVLRSHPALSKALGNRLGRDEFQLGVLSQTSMTSLVDLIVGLMESQEAASSSRFLKPSSDLDKLLKLASSPISPHSSWPLRSAIDVAIFHGLKFEAEVDLGEEYILLPFHELSAHLETEWLQGVATKQVNWRRTEPIFGIARKFHWKPKIGGLHKPPNTQARQLPPLFHRWADEFANLLSVTLSRRVSWVATFEGCIPRRAACLLGNKHWSAHKHEGRSISHLFSPFQEYEAVEEAQIDVVRDIFARRRETEYPETAAIIQRLAEALRREGRFALEDKILDLAIVFERFFKPRGRSIARELAHATADYLGKEDAEKTSIKEQMRQFYKVRSAIVHGPTDERRTRLLRQAEVAWNEAYKLARAAVLKKID